MEGGRVDSIDHRDRQPPPIRSARFDRLVGLGPRHNLPIEQKREGRAEGREGGREDDQGRGRQINRRSIYRLWLTRAGCSREKMK